MKKTTTYCQSKRRCCVEHVFGFIEGVMYGSFVRTIGIARAKANFVLTCLVYNIFRYCQINKYQPQLLSCKGLLCLDVKKYIKNEGNKTISIKSEGLL